MKTLRDIIGLWPSRKDVAAVIGQPVSVVHNFCRADRVLPAHFDLILYRDAVRRNLPVTLDEWIFARSEASGHVKTPLQGAGGE